MGSIQTALNGLTKSKLSFYLSFAFYSVALFALTTVFLLNSIISQLHSNLSTYDIHLFTAGEVQEIKSYYVNWFIYSCLGILLVLLIAFGVLFLKRKRIMNQLTLKPLSFSLRLLFILLLSFVFLMVLFVLFESFYQQFLQYFYQHSLDKFNDLPNFVLSNGNSGFAFSLRWPLSMYVSSRTFFQLFMLSLVKAFGLLTLLVLPLSLFFRLLIKKQPFQNVRD